MVKKYTFILVLAAVLIIAWFGLKENFNDKRPHISEILASEAEVMEHIRAAFACGDACNPKFGNMSTAELEREIIPGRDNRYIKYRLGMSYHQDGFYEKALLQFQELAYLGYADAQEMLGFMYLNGEGVLKSRVKGCAWFMATAKFNKSDESDEYKQSLGKAVMGTLNAKEQREDEVFFNKIIGEIKP